MSEKPIDPIYFQSFAMQPSRGDQRRIEIIAAAIGCFADEALGGGILERVAEKLKIRRSHVAYYFPNQSELFDAVLKYLFVTGQKVTVERIARARTSAEQIHAMGDAVFEWAEKYPDQASVMMLFYYKCTGHPGYRKLQEEIRETGYERLLALSAQILDARKLAKSGIDAETAVRTLHAVMVGLGIDFILAGRKHAERFRARWERACAAWLSAFGGS